MVNHKLRALAVRLAVRVLLGTALPLSANVATAQQTSTDPVTVSIARAKSGNFNNLDIKNITQAGAAQEIIPALEQQFAAARDTDRQGVLASYLVRLGDKDDSYWNFLVEQATLAVDSDVPDAVYDSKGNAREKELSPEFTAWAKAHHVDLSTAVQSAMCDLPGKVYSLAATGDRRSIPLLRRGLQSHNSMVVIMAAKGLAQAQDKDSIPLIIEACRRSPSGLAGGIAQLSLIYFDDPQAQAAVDTYVEPKRAKLWSGESAKGLKSLGY